jgi:hypothetical protein
MPGYIMYRRDRKKGGGWLLAYFQRNILSKEIKIPKTYKTLESIAVEAQVGRKDILFLGIYRPPKQSKTNLSSNYLERVEELNDVCMWTSTHK